VIGPVSRFFKEEAIELLPDWTIAYQWVIFMLVVLVLNWGIFQPALHLLAARRAATKGANEEAEECEARIVELSQAVELSLRSARQEGQEIIQGLRQEADLLATQSIQEARVAMETHVRAAEARVSKQAKESDLQLRQHAQELAQELGQRLLERNI
jgi:F0F1-type ATP synthase membrane subunit b/b'